MQIVDVRPHERRAMWASFAFFFFILSGYFILRPIRDAVAVATGVRDLPWLFTGTLVATLIANPLFWSLVVRYPVRRFVLITYHFFAANLVAFYIGMRAFGASASSPALGIVFYIWTSMVSLFLTSLFWAYMADIFRSDQAKRLFGFIGVGGTLGSIAGSLLTASLAERIGTVNLLLVSAALLELAMVVVARFPAAPRMVEAPVADALRDDARERQAEAALRDDAPRRGPSRGGDDRTVIGGNLLAGITGILRSPYLTGIAGFLVLYVINSTFLYFQQTDLIGRFYSTPESRTAILAKIEVAVQTLTVITQIFFTGRVIKWLGLGLALALLPALSILGFSALGVAPVLASLIAFTVTRRAMNFAITNPAMEVLFTVVSREDKYKAKSFIETFVYRAGDQVAAWTYAGLSRLGLGVSGTAFAALPLAGIWLFLGVWLGRRQQQIARAQERDAGGMEGGPGMQAAV